MFAISVTQEKRTFLSGIWLRIHDKDKLTDAVVYYIVDPDQRYLKNEIFRHSKSRDASNCGWNRVSWKKNGDFGLCYTGEKWKTTKTKWNDVAEKCKSKKINDCRCFIENSNGETKNYYSESQSCKINCEKRDCTTQFSR